MLTLGIAAIVAFGIIDQGEVNAQSVTGAICVYLLLGLAFTFVYGALAALDSGPFFAQGTDGTLATRLYFSYVTLTTVGYGDYTARTNAGHMLGIIEALDGPALPRHRGRAARLAHRTSTGRRDMTDSTAEFFAELERRGHEPLLAKVKGTIRFDIVEGKKKARWLVSVDRGDVTVSRRNVVRRLGRPRRPRAVRPARHRPRERDGGGSAREDRRRGRARALDPVPAGLPRASAPKGKR